MFRLPVKILLLATLASVAITSGLPSPVEQAYNTPKREGSRVRRDTDSGDKCTIQEKEGKCVPYLQCDIESLPTSADLDQVDVALKSILVCKSSVEVCCPLNGIGEPNEE